MVKNGINRWARLRLDQMNEISLNIIQKIFEFEQVFEKEQCDLLVSLQSFQFEMQLNSEVVANINVVI